MASKKKAKSEFSAPLKKFALGLPGAWEDHPWGESVAKVAKKVFVFFGHDADADFGMSVKLPETKHEALLRLGRKLRGLAQDVPRSPMRSRPGTASGKAAG